MADGETIETKISDKKDEFEEKTYEKKDDMKDKYEETKEKGKTIADNVIGDLSSDLSRSIDEFKENLKNMQKAADKKYADYKKTTVQSLDVDLVETEDVYYVKAAVPGIDKEDILIEAGDNDISIEATFVPYIEEFEEDEAELIVNSLKSGRCVKTIRFENSIDLENISAKFNNGMVIINIPKLVIPKHKVNVE